MFTFLQIRVINDGEHRIKVTTEEQGETIFDIKDFS